MTPPSTSVEHEKEIEFCSFMQYIFSEEPFHTEFKINSAIISFYIYHNDESLNVLDEILIKFDIYMYGLSDNGWRDFTVRPVSASGALAQTYGYGLLFESINQNCIDLFVNCDNMENYLHVN